MTDEESKIKIIDKWVAHKGPRTGLLRVEVQRAKRLEPLSVLIPCNTFIVIESETSEFQSEVCYNDVNPEYAFKTEFLVENDMRSIPLKILYHVPLSGDMVHPFYGNTLLNLRDPYDNLQREVTPEGVYFERCAVTQDLYDKRNKPYPDAEITIKWMLEVREVNMVATCDTCGKLEARCKCPPEERERRQREQKEAAMAKLAAEMAAAEERMRREEEERTAREEKQRRQQAQELSDRTAQWLQKKQWASEEMSITQGKEWAALLIMHGLEAKKVWNAATRRRARENTAMLAVAAENNTRSLQHMRWALWRTYVQEKAEAKAVHSGDFYEAQKRIALAEESKRFTSLVAEEKKRNELAALQEQRSKEVREYLYYRGHIHERDGTEESRHNKYNKQHDDADDDPWEVDEDGIPRPVRVHDSNNKSRSVDAEREGGKKEKTGCNCALM